MAALNIVRKFFPKVEKVVDAIRPARIEVTGKDISSKAVKNHSECAMAVACKRRFHLDGVIMARSTAYLIKGKQARRFHVPPSVAREIVAFDRGATFAPGIYQLVPVSKNQRFGVKPVMPAGSHIHNNNPHFRHVTNKIRTVLFGENPKE